MAQEPVDSRCADVTTTRIADRRIRVRPRPVSFLAESYAAGQSASRSNSATMTCGGFPLSTTSRSSRRASSPSTLTRIRSVASGVSLVVADVGRIDRRKPCVEVTGLRIVSCQGSLLIASSQEAYARPRWSSSR